MAEILEHPNQAKETKPEIVIPEEMKKLLATKDAYPLNERFFKLNRAEKIQVIREFVELREAQKNEFTRLNDSMQRLENMKPMPFNEKYFEENVWNKNSQPPKPLRAREVDKDELN